MGRRKSDVYSEWVGMPEFVQEKQEPYAKIIFRFETENDLNEFSRLIGQRLTNKTKSAWHPFKSHWSDSKQEWIDESEVSDIHCEQGSSPKSADEQGS